MHLLQDNTDQKKKGEYETRNKKKKDQTRCREPVVNKSFPAVDTTHNPHTREVG